MTRRRLFTWRKALVWGRGSATATRRADPKARPCYPWVSTIRSPGTKGVRPQGRRARKQGIPRRPGQRLERSGQLTERDPLPRQRRPDSGPSTVGPSGARAWPEQVPGASRPRPASTPARAARQPAGLTKRGGSRPAAPRGSRTAAGDCPRPRRLRPRLSRRTSSPAGAPHLPRAPRSHRPPAALPPPPPAPGPSPPLRLPPQPAPPAPGSASRPRPLGASTSGQARTGKAALQNGPVAGLLSPEFRSRSVPEPGRGRSGERQPWSRFREGAATALLSKPPARVLLSAPCWREEDSAAGRAPGLPERNGWEVRTLDPPSPGACAHPPLGPPLPRLSLS